MACDGGKKPGDSEEPAGDTDMDSDCDSDTDTDTDTDTDSNARTVRGCGLGRGLVKEYGQAIL